MNNKFLFLAILTLVGVLTTGWIMNADERAEAAKCDIQGASLRSLGWQLDPEKAKTFRYGGKTWVVMSKETYDSINP